MDWGTFKWIPFANLWSTELTACIAAIAPTSEVLLDEEEAEVYISNTINCYTRHMVNYWK